MALNDTSAFVAPTLLETSRMQDVIDETRYHMACEFKLSNQIATL
jgi:hypothetical protein